LIQETLKNIEREKKEMLLQREKGKELREAQQRMEEAMKIEEEKKRAVWSDIELMWLAKAVQKYPSGCHNRWGQIRDMVNLMAKNPTNKERTEKDVIKQVRIMNQKKLQTGFSTAYNKKLKFSAGDKTNNMSSTTTSGSQERSKGVVKKEGGKSIKSAQLQESKKQKRKKKNSSKKKGSKEKLETAANTTTTTTTTTTTASESEPSKEWSAVQQAALETALRNTPKGPERWDQIAEKVPGKSKKDCVRRFKEIRAKIMAQRAAK